MDLSDEAASLASNVQAMNRLHDSLGTFNEAFAGYLYALRMNAFCVEWTEVRRVFTGWLEICMDSDVMVMISMP